MPTVTESLNTLISNTGTLATTVTGRITDMDGKITSANTAKTDAETAKGQAETARDTATAQATTATTQAGISTAQAGIATTKASDATTQAGISTTQASTATTQAGTATSQAGIATTQASTATTQAGIATTKASEASTSASNASSAAAAAATTAVNAVIDTAPANLNTLNELAAALGDDANYASTTTTALGNRYTKSETDAKIVELSPPATKAHVDSLGINADTVDGIQGSSLLQKSGGTMTGNLNLGDNDKVQLGASQDLLIYHDGSNSIIKDIGTGNLKLQGTQLQLTNDGGTEKYLDATLNGSVALYYANNVKLVTKTYGAEVLGNVAVTGTVDGRDVATDGTKLDTVATNANYITNNNQLSNGAGYTTAVGDITNVSAGTGLTGGGSSGSVTLSPHSSYNGYGYRTVSTGGPSGGSNGDVWYKY